LVLLVRLFVNGSETSEPFGSAPSDQSVA
jgi:hypothetical protein